MGMWIFSRKRGAKTVRIVNQLVGYCRSSNIFRNFRESEESIYPNKAPVPTLRDRYQTKPASPEAAVSNVNHIRSGNVTEECTPQIVELFEKPKIVSLCWQRRITSSLGDNQHPFNLLHPQSVLLAKDARAASEPMDMHRVAAPKGCKRSWARGPMQQQPGAQYNRSVNKQADSNTLFVNRDSDIRPTTVLSLASQQLDGQTISLRREAEVRRQCSFPGRMISSTRTLEYFCFARQLASQSPCKVKPVALGTPEPGDVGAALSQSKTKRLCLPAR